MHISIDWIKDFTDLPDLPDRELATRFTMATCEVDGIETVGAALEQVSVAEVTGVEPHPNADKLSLVTFDAGTKTGRVVCGAPNVAVGQKVPYAPVGTTLPVGFTLESKKIRGVLSEGMLCSEAELGLGEDASGLMILSADALVGTPLTVYLNLHRDLLFDIDNKSITHRPDLWGHYGMAREFAAVFGHPLRVPYDEAWEARLKAAFTDDVPPVTLDVNVDSANRGFTAVTVDGITVGESPAWMQRRLNACGMRPINSIVDISNYVMLELGMPNHIFDTSTLKGGKIVVRRAGERQGFITLDEQERVIEPVDTMVCDAERPNGIAGIMGGLESSVTADTSRITIEVANWDAPQIRRSSARLGLRTDSSQRYEKSLDSGLLERSLLRLLDLVLQLNPGARPVGGLQMANMPSVKPLIITVHPDRITRELGKEVSAAEIRRILESLEFTVTEDAAGAFAVEVPGWRATKDIECEADIVEEIGRIVGYDNIVPEPPLTRPLPVRLSAARRLNRRIEDYLVLRARALQVMTYPLIGEKLLEKADWPVRNEGLRLANALSPEMSLMRPSLVPSLLQAVADNQKEYRAFRLFETGRSYRENPESFSEDRYQLGFALCDRKGGTFSETADLTEGLMDYLNLPAKLVPGRPRPDHPLLPEGWAGIHPHEFLDVVIMGRSAGFVMTVHPLVARSFKIKGSVTLLVLDVTDIQDREPVDKTKYRPLFRFPSSHFDVTVVAAEEEPAAKIVRALTGGLRMKELASARVLDLFELEGGRKAVTLRAEFRDEERTLPGEFISDAEKQVVEVLEKAGYPLRS